MYHIIIIEVYYLIKLFKFTNCQYKNWLNLTIVILFKIVYNNIEPGVRFSFHNVGQKTLYYVTRLFRNVQQLTLHYDTKTFRNVGQKTLYALYVFI